MQYNTGINVINLWQINPWFSQMDQYFTIGTYPSINDQPGTGSDKISNGRMQDVITGEPTFKQQDASFLFPQLQQNVQKGNLSTYDDGFNYGSPAFSVKYSNGYSTNNPNFSLNEWKSKFEDSECPKAVFQVTKIPKAAFSMISRKDLCRPRYDDAYLESEDCFEPSGDSSIQRKQIFGNKRDDLYYKTICRDVRKFIQERFHTFLGELRINDVVRKGDFLKKINEFRAHVMGVDPHEDFDTLESQCCLATFISSYHFQRIWKKNHGGTEPEDKLRCKHQKPYVSKQELCNFSLRIHNSLLRFTKTKLKSLCSIKGFREIIKFYGSEVIERENYKRLGQHKTMRGNLKGYKFALNDILRMCGEYE